MEKKERICLDCKHHRYNRRVMECGKAKHTNRTYSNGVDVIWYDLCDVVNHSGECSKYEYQPTFWETIKPFLCALNFLNWPPPRA